MSIPELEKQIREFINSSRKQSELAKNTSDWNKLCSSLDLIGDTQLAVDSYAKFHNAEDDGSSYLIIYGILQALLLQQNAAKHIGDSLGIKVKLPKELSDIRVIRNSAGGHPTFQKENGLSKSCFITRMSISPTSFQLMTVYSGDREYDFNTISIPSLISTQKTFLSGILGEIVMELRRQEMQHRENHKGIKFSDYFPHTISYHISKILEATYPGNDRTFGSVNLKMISECIGNFKKELSSRGEWGVYDSINYHYEMIEYPFKRMENYFIGSDDMNNKDAYIFTSFIANQIESLEEIAKELDEKYETAV